MERRKAKAKYRMKNHTSYSKTEDSSVSMLKF
jgi:hypothetical protein